MLQDMTPAESQVCTFWDLQKDPERRFILMIKNINLKLIKY